MRLAWASLQILLPAICHRPPRVRCGLSPFNLRQSQRVLPIRYPITQLSGIQVCYTLCILKLNKKIHQVQDNNKKNFINGLLLFDSENKKYRAVLISPSSVFKINKLLLGCAF
jgi:hypothetical protein